MPLVELTISQAHSAFLAEKLTCSDLVASYLQVHQCLLVEISQMSFAALDAVALSH